MAVASSAVSPILELKAPSFTNILSPRLIFIPSIVRGAASRSTTSVVATLTDSLKSKDVFILSTYCLVAASNTETGSLLSITDFKN